jgi:salicylate hydroxylase
VIAGAGIGGLTAALAFAKAGFAVTVVEKRTSFSETGAGIQISPNAFHVLNLLGLGSSLRRAGCEPEQVVIRAMKTGQRLGLMALKPFMQEQFDAPYITLLRADLHMLLLDAVRGHSTIRLLVGREAMQVMVHEHHVELAVMNGRGMLESIEGNAIVGADGLHSSLRHAVGDKREPVFQNAMAWRAVVPVAEAPELLQQAETGLWLGREGHVVHYPVAGGKLLNIVAIQSAVAPFKTWSAEQNLDLLQKHYQQTTPLLQSLLKIPSEWMGWSLFDLPVACLNKGRLVLLGDAGHPILPYLAQGAALAIEDAYCLASFCAKDPSNLPGAFQAYAKQRTSRIRKVQNAARRNGALYRATGLKALGRNMIMRQLGPEGMARYYAWLYGWRSG